MNVRYRFKELRAMAKDQDIKRRGYMNKDQLCEALGVAKDKDLPRYSLTCVKMLEVTKWRSTTVISKTFKTDVGNVFYALKVGKPLKTSAGSFTVKKNYFPECI